jgi:hypothetical protein
MAMKRMWTVVTVVGLLLGTSSVAKAITFTGTSGTLAASADFTQSGTNLIVVLTNTSTTDVDDPASVLTALFFDLAGVGALTPVSALLTAGSTVFYDPDGQPAGGNVGGEWAYESGLAGAPGGASEGISSSGFGLFGDSNFNGPDLSPPIALNGVNYGILPAGDDETTANGGLLNSEGLIKNSVTFTLSGLPDGFILTAGDIANVTFQYGTGLNETNFPGGPGPSEPGGTPGGSEPGGEIPEPASLLLMGSGLAAAAMKLRRRQK